MKPKRWLDVFQNDDEQAFFIAATRGPRVWLTVAEIARRSGLDEITVERIIGKYIGSLIWQHDTWGQPIFGYWERIAADAKISEKPKLSISQMDKQRRIDAYLTSE